METSRLNIVLQGVNIEDGARICAPHFKVFHQKKETKSSRGNFGKPAWKSVKQTQQIKSSLVHCKVQRKVVGVGHSRQAERHNSLSHVAAQEHLSSNLSSLISSSLPSIEVSMKQVDTWLLYSDLLHPQFPTLLCSTPKQSTSA